MLDTEIGHDEYDCVAGEDVVTAVHVLPVDGEAAPGEDGDHPVDYQQRSDVLPANLLRALVAGVWLGQHCHEDSDRPVEIYKNKWNK